MTENVSIIVATYDRPDALLTTLTFLQSGRERFPIVVADGSGSEAAVRNAATCARLGANISYLHRPSITGKPGSHSAEEYAKIIEHYWDRYTAALDLVTTDYVVNCADDDLLLPGNASRAATFLDANPDYVACHGCYLTFREIDAGIQVESVTYDGKSIDGEEALSRLMQLLARYEALFYGVYRTPLQREIVARGRHVKNGLFAEVFHSCASVLMGKIKRMDSIYYLRNMGIAHHPRPLQDWLQWAATDLDGLCDSYREHRQSIIDLLASRSDLAINADILRRALDMSFILYVGRTWVPEYMVEQYLKTAIASEGERERLSSRLLAELRGNLSAAAPDAQAYPGRAVASEGWTALRTAIRESGAIFVRWMQKKRKRLIGGRRGHVVAACGSDEPAWTNLLGQAFPTVRIATALRDRFSQDEWAVLVRPDAALLARK